MPEPRSAVRILVEASWKDQTGALLVVPAWIENKSASGACIRVKTQIGVGSNLSLQGRWEQMSGTAKYCRSVGNAYLVGIQRDKTNRLVEKTKSAVTAVSTEIQGAAERREGKQKEIPRSDPKVDAVPIMQHQDAVIPQAELKVRVPPRTPEAGKERKPMQRKWSELMHRRDKQDELAGSGNEATDSKSEQEKRAFPLGGEKGVSADLLKDGIASFPVELARVEDIYRTAGIMSPRSGYGIGKVIEMLHSEHTRELSRDAKQAAVLMALGVAGIPISEVLEDAQARQDALDSCEAQQRKALDAEWQRKAEENLQIQAELERIKEHLMARISRNLDGVAREKAAFNSWLTMKQQECQSISEAAELCVKSAALEPANALQTALSMAAAGGKSV